MSEFTLVTGGARSGKSSFAELLAKHYQLPVTYIATAQVWDHEMAVRVRKHRESRPLEWNLIEEPVKIAEALQSLETTDGVILLDCVTLWLTNLLLRSEESSDSTPESAFDPVQKEIEIFSAVNHVVKTIKEIQPRVIFVTNEVGQGIVPENPLARTYRDLAGHVNQILGQAADAVYYVVAGYPIEIKHPGTEIINTLIQKG